MTDAVIVAVRVSADPERAFIAFTRDIAVWWKHNPLFAATPRSPGEMAFEPGPEGRLVERLSNGKTFEIGKVKVWEPGARLVFGWRTATFGPDMDGEVEVTFQSVAPAQTRVTVTHRNWLAVPRDNPARHGFPDLLFQQRYAAWLNDLLGSLAAILRP